VGILLPVTTPTLRLNPDGVQMTIEQRGARIVASKGLESVAA
jgi:hypothetical protein